MVSRSRSARSPAPSLSPNRRVQVIGIGVQKAATTWLFRCLVQHPEVRGAEVTEGSNKELNFFNHFYDRGYLWYHDLFEFGPWKNAEFSTRYFHDRDAPARLHRYNAKAKLLLALRNPVDRAFSQHKHEYRRGRLTEEFREFRAALQFNPAYIEQGRYATHLERWLEHFDLEQIHVVDYADIVDSPADVMRETYRFVGVGSDFVPPSLQRRVNRSEAIRSQTFKKVLRATINAGRTLFHGPVKRAVKWTGLHRRLRRLNRTPVEEVHVPPLSSEDRSLLMEEEFREEIARLEELLQWDLSHWR